jgi:hypothetical protein
MALLAKVVRLLRGTLPALAVLAVLALVALALRGDVFGGISLPGLEGGGDSGAQPLDTRLGLGLGLAALQGSVGLRLHFAWGVPHAQVD